MRRSLVWWEEELQAHPIQPFLIHREINIQYSWTGIPNIKLVYSYQSKYNTWVINNAMRSSCSNTYTTIKAPNNHICPPVFNKLTLQLYLKETDLKAVVFQQQQWCARSIWRWIILYEERRKWTLTVTHNEHSYTYRDSFIGLFLNRLYNQL